MGEVVAAIAAQGLSKVFKDPLRRKTHRALSDLTLEIAEGEVFGFLGPNGAGKSTAIKILLGLLHPSSGQAYILGRPVQETQIRRRVGYLPENPYFYDHLTPEELLWFGGSVSGMAPSEIRERSAVLLELLEIDHARRRPLRTFSKGMLQRAGLALALINDPKVVILDEPMSGLDPIGRQLVAGVIKKLRAEGKTVFFSSHILHDVENLCDRVGIIVSGELRLLTRLEEIKLSPPRGWRVVIQGQADGLGSEIPNIQRVTSNPSFSELHCPQMDVYHLIEWLRKRDARIISIEPRREALEELFLRVLNRSRGADG